MSAGSGYYSLQTGEELTDSELHERYDDMLDAVYEGETIAGISIVTSRALREYDPIAYRVGFSDWLDAETGETITDDAELAAEIRGDSDAD